MNSDNGLKLFLAGFLGLGFSYVMSSACSIGGCGRLTSEVWLALALSCLFVGVGAAKHRDIDVSGEHEVKHD